jgi:hypothetical protein
MANEITTTITGSLANGSLSDQFSTSKQITQTTAGVAAGVWIVGTSEEDLSLGDVTTGGTVYMVNLDSTNYVKLGPKSGGSMVEAIRLKPGEPQLFRIPSGVTLRAIADTAACRVLFKAWET